MTDARARNSDPATSHEAAARVEAFDAAHYRLILDALAVLKEATAEEIGEFTKIGHHATARRLPEMQKRELVTPTGKVRVNRSGRAARVWRAL